MAIVLRVRSNQLGSRPIYAIYPGARCLGSKLLSLAGSPSKHHVLWRLVILTLRNDSSHHHPPLPTCQSPLMLPHTKCCPNSRNQYSSHTIGSTSSWLMPDTKYQPPCPPLSLPHIQLNTTYSWVRTATCHNTLGCHAYVISQHARWPIRTPRPTSANLGRWVVITPKRPKANSIHTAAWHNWTQTPSRNTA